MMSIQLLSLKLKHMAGKHPQKSHGRGGSSGGGVVTEPVGGYIVIINPQIFDLNEITAYNSPFLYNTKTGELIFTKTKKAQNHLDLMAPLAAHKGLDNSGTIKYLDDSVHGYIKGKTNPRKITFDPNYAAGLDRITWETDKEVAYNNIYKAMDALANIDGIHASTPVDISAGFKIKPDISTTLKTSLVEALKHMAGKHPQKSHGRGGSESGLKVSGKPDPGVLIEFESVLNEVSNDFPFVGGEILELDFNGDTAGPMMNWDSDDQKFTMHPIFSNFDLATNDRIIDGWGETSGTLLGGVDTTFKHELGHVVATTIRKHALAVGGVEASGRYSDGVRALRAKLGDPSEYSKTNLGEWTSERYALEATKRADPVLTNYMKSEASNLGLMEDYAPIRTDYYNRQLATTLKHMAGKHPQKSHGRGGSESGSGGKVWDGQPVEWDGPKLTKLEVGERGERLAMKVLSDIKGVPFSTLNVGVNNAPIDVAGNHTAVEVKAGLATNGKSAQHWRATIGQPGKAERAQIAQMTKGEKKAHHAYKSEKILERKAAMVDSMSEAAGAKINGKTIGVILHPDGTRGDVYLFDGFHSRISWQKAAADGEFLGTHEV